jgi:hypothetical protein
LISSSKPIALISGIWGEILPRGLSHLRTNSFQIRPPAEIVSNRGSPSF